MCPDWNFISPNCSLRKLISIILYSSFGKSFEKISFISFLYSSFSLGSLLQFLGGEFLTVTNIFPHIVYLYFFNLNKFISFFNDNKYEMVVCKKNKFAKVYYKNFYPFVKNVVYADILFKKKIN